MNHTTTHSYATVPVTVGALAQVAAILEETGYESAVERDSGNNITLIDMHGLTLTPLVNIYHDFELSWVGKFSPQFLITPFTPKAFAFLAREYAAWEQRGRALVCRAKGVEIIHIIDKIQKAGMTIDLTRI